ncbi:MAG: methyltransferase domain-containing protein [Woeseiaceae bacterium]|nr:methyltransferase domain-containing protein [Woeseiaceae bacterium]NIP21268.1 methyltransferase domain-containing protein [Woeseiaceae bacterium]NIS90240.1 methyltransferase domain-containing protein [Woeseiaceae bacterium]
MDTDFARQQMVEQQVRAWDVLHPDVLRVLKDIPREQFVPNGYEPLAFADTEIPIGHGETMMTPTIEGRVLQALQPTPSDTVLEIGTGTGFLAACLRRLSAGVTSIDIHGDFLDSARANLEDSGIADVTLLKMDATRQLPQRQFDVIAVTGSIEKFDPRFVDALVPGGRLFIVVGAAPAMDARLVTRTGENDWHSESLFETVLTPLVNATQPPQFLF